MWLVGKRGASPRGRREPCCAGRGPRPRKVPEPSAEGPDPGRGDGALLLGAAFPGNVNDMANSVAVSQATGTVFVNGLSGGSGSSADDATIAYHG